MTEDKKNDSEKLVELGKFYFLNQKYDQAVEEYRQAVELDPKNTDALYNLGIALETINDQEAARDAFEKLLELDPEYKGAQEHYDRLVEQ
jgi:Flp pilus assembly protein TadD